jgi:hypothetical protein
MSLDKWKERVRPECEINRIAPSKAERDTNAPLREAMAIKRERWRAKRAAIEGAKQKKPATRG